MLPPVRLRRDFKLVHEPLRHGDKALPGGQAAVAQALCDRLAHSTGGAFLVTGFRGVGKTTAVHRALGALADATGEQVIAITVPVARPVPPAALLFEVIRRLVERLQETGILARLTPEVRDAILVAYARTSMMVKETSTRSEEWNRELSIGGPTTLSRHGPPLPLPRLSSSRRRSDSLATELSFVAYTEADAEHDFLRIVEMLRRPDALRPRRLARVLARYKLARRDTPLGAHLVVVFDEIDKLTSPEGGLADFEDLMSALKNLLTASGVHFVVVGGVDLHDEWLSETSRANSLYRSLFAWQAYTPCTWGAARTLLDDAVAGELQHDSVALASYLEYRSRGIVRALLYELHELVSWDTDGPHISLSADAQTRIALLAELHDLVEREVAAAPDALLSNPSDVDRLRQSSYFIVDWVLRSDGERFTVADVLDVTQNASIDPVLRSSGTSVTAVLETLADASMLTAHRARGTREGAAASIKEDQYQLAAVFHDRLRQIAARSPRGVIATESVGLADAGAAVITGGARAPIVELIAPKYQLDEQVSQGAFGGVWLAHDRETGQRVVVKIARQDASSREGIKRELELLLKLNDVRGIVPAVDVLESDDRMGIVMPFVSGTPLASVARMATEDAVRLTIALLDTLQEVHALGVVHRDIKPQNILLIDGKPRLIDFSVASRAGEQPFYTRSGTPAYSAPEQMLGADPEIRADLYSVGATLLFLLSAEPPRDLSAKGRDLVLGGLVVSAELERVLARALDLEPERRFSTAAEMADALRRVPEIRVGDPTDSDGGGEAIDALLAAGESETVEFKATAFTRSTTTLADGRHPADGRVVAAIVRTVVAFLNGAGGTLVLGVAEQRELLRPQAAPGGTGPSSQADATGTVAGDWTIVGVNDEIGDGGWQQYAAKLSDVIERRIEPRPVGLYRIFREDLGERIVARIGVDGHRRGDAWYYARADGGEPARFYVRSADRDIWLDGADADRYKARPL
jgi:predicted Ser/Thr protein kinase